MKYLSDVKCSKCNRVFNMPYIILPEVLLCRGCAIDEDGLC